MELNKKDFGEFALIAHRGLHNPNVSENSLRAFSLAKDSGLAFELDVHLSKDGKLVVCHDSNLKRVSGREGYIPDLTLEEIKREYRLLDGQEVPTLEEVLSLNEENVPMVVELKVDKSNGDALAKTVLSALSQIKDKDRVSLISFHPNALKKCRNKGFSTGLLVCKEHPNVKLLSAFFDYLDVEDCLLDDPYYQKLRRKGKPINTWTIERKDQLEKIRGRVDMITFQHLEIDDVRLVLEEGKDE